MSVLTYLEAGFAEALSRHIEILNRWVSVSLRGLVLPKSLLPASIQDLGNLDVVLRCSEDEIAVILKDGHEIGFRAHIPTLLSNLWIGSAYEIIRLVREREIVQKSDELEGLLWDLSLLRIPLEKHEIAGFKRVGKIILRPQPAQPGDQDEIYDPADRKRAHILPWGFSSRGSVMWCPYDHKISDTRWIERQHLSDRMLDLWDPMTAEPAQKPVDG